MYNKEEIISIIIPLLLVFAMSWEGFLPENFMFYSGQAILTIIIILITFHYNNIGVVPDY
jgi:hypothetical protein